jgi:hypothetical protein
MPHLTQPLASHQPVFTYLENQLLSYGGEYPSTLVRGLLKTAPPFASSTTLSQPPRSSYNIYIDNINNTSRPRLAHI